MKKGAGVIVRLIDVVLNLLFGFLMITDIIHKTEIKLPSIAGRAAVVSEKKVLPIEIKIVPGDTVIAAIDPKTENSLRVLSQLYGYYFIQEDVNTYRIRMLDRLDEYLVTTKTSYDSITVIINPDPGSIIQGTINLVDACRKYGIEKKFRFIEREEE
jgi:biopolymer transport protein ExbD